MFEDVFVVGGLSTKPHVGWLVDGSCVTERTHLPCCACEPAVKHASEIPDGKREPREVFW